MLSLQSFFLYILCNFVSISYMFSRYNIINTILIESVYPFTYVIIVMVCNSFLI